MYGADVEELDQLSRAMDRASEELQSKVQQLSSGYQQDIWRGPDAERARNAWSSDLSVQIRSVAEALTQCADTLRRNAQDQRAASGSGAGATRTNSVSQPVGSAMGSAEIPWWFTAPRDAFQGLQNIESVATLATLLTNVEHAKSGLGRLLNSSGMQRFSRVMTGMTVGVQAVEFINATNHNDRFMSGVDITTTLLRSSPNPKAWVAGTAMNAAKILGEELAVADFTPSGVQLVMDEVGNNPRVLVEEVGKAIGEVLLFR